MSPHEAKRYNERSSCERFNGRLKEGFGGKWVMVRGSTKVMMHLIFGVVTLFADQLLKVTGYWRNAGKNQIKVELRLLQEAHVHILFDNSRKKRVGSLMKRLVPYSLKAVIKNKKTGGTLKTGNLKTPPDSERRETFEVLIPAYFPFTGVRTNDIFMQYVNQPYKRSGTLWKGRFFTRNPSPGCID